MNHWERMSTNLFVGRLWCLERIIVFVAEVFKAVVNLYSRFYGVQGHNATALTSTSTKHGFEGEHTSFPQNTWHQRVTLDIDNLGSRLHDYLFVAHFFAFSKGIMKERWCLSTLRTLFLHDIPKQIFIPFDQPETITFSMQQLLIPVSLDSFNQVLHLNLMFLSHECIFFCKLKLDLTFHIRKFLGLLLFNQDPYFLSVKIIFHFKVNFFLLSVLYDYLGPFVIVLEFLGVIL